MNVSQALYLEKREEIKISPSSHISKMYISLASAYVAHMSNLHLSSPSES